MPYVIPALPASTTVQIWYAATQVFLAINAPTELAVGVFLGFMVIAAIVRIAGWELGPLPDYEDVGDSDDRGGTFGGPALSDTVDWDELDRRASGSLEHDAML